MEEKTTQLIASTIPIDSRTLIEKKPIRSGKQTIELGMYESAVIFYDNEGEVIEGRGLYDINVANEKTSIFIFRKEQKRLKTGTIKIEFREMDFVYTLRLPFSMSINLQFLIDDYVKLIRRLKSNFTSIATKTLVDYLTSLASFPIKRGVMDFIREENISILDLNNRIEGLRIALTHSINDYMDKVGISIAVLRIDIDMKQSDNLDSIIKVLSKKGEMQAMDYLYSDEMLVTLFDEYFKKEEN